MRRGWIIFLQNERKAHRRDALLLKILYLIDNKIRNYQNTEDGVFSLTVNHI